MAIKMVHAGFQKKHDLAQIVEMMQYESKRFGGYLKVI